MAEEYGKSAYPKLCKKRRVLFRDTIWKITLGLRVLYFDLNWYVFEMSSYKTSLPIFNVSKVMLDLRTDWLLEQGHSRSHLVCCRTSIHDAFAHVLCRRRY